MTTTIATTATAVAIPLATGGIITDQVIQATIDATNRARAGELNDADAALLLLVAGPALEELLQRRQAAVLISGLASGRVLPFTRPGA